MPGTALDTSVIIAGLLDWHEAHPRVFPVLQGVLSAEETAILPIHSLLESYSVITRLPRPRRLSPADAWTILSDSFRNSARLVGLDDHAEAWSLIEQLVGRNLTGGVVYDAFILACARRADADRILTLNGRHFRRLVGEDDDVEVWQPT